MVSVLKGEEQVEFISSNGASRDGVILDFSENRISDDTIQLSTEDQMKLLKWLVNHIDL